MDFGKIGFALVSVGLGTIVLIIIMVILAAIKPIPDAEDVNVVGRLFLFAIGVAGLSAGLLMAILILMGSVTFTNSK